MLRPFCATHVHDEIESKVLDEKVGVVSERLSVQGVEDGVAGSVSGGSTSVSLSALSKVERLSTESSLVDLALLGSRERDTVVLQLTVSCAPRAGLCDSPRRRCWGPLDTCSG